MKLKLAVVQLAVKPLDPIYNLKKMERLIKVASQAGANLVVFPEDSVTGPLSGQTNFVQYAEEYLIAFQSLAIKYGVDLVPGTWTTTSGAVKFNTAYYINFDGTVAGYYNKINLWQTEKAIMAPGTHVSVFPTRFGNVGLTICWDLSFPMLYSDMAKKGAQLIISPSYWSFTLKAKKLEKAANDEIELIDSLCLIRAFENNVAIAYCNAAGEVKSEGVHAVLSGRSQVTHPTKKILCRSTGNKEEILYADLKLI